MGDYALGLARVNKIGLSPCSNFIWADLVRLRQHLSSEGLNLPVEARHVIRLCTQHHMRRS